MQQFAGHLIITEAERYIIRGGVLLGLCETEMHLKDEMHRDNKNPSYVKIEYMARNIVKYYRALEALSWDGNNWPVFTAEEMNYDGRDLILDEYLEVHAQD